MKRWMAFLLVMVMVCTAGALAEGIGSRMSVRGNGVGAELLDEPEGQAEKLAQIPDGAEVALISLEDGGFAQVCYEGNTGYVRGETLREVEDYRGEPVSLSGKHRYNFNLFLSNFTEVGFLWRSGCYDQSAVDYALLTDFAVDHCWFNRKNRLEWGNYFNGNNVRLPESQVAPVVEKYFGFEIAPSRTVPFLDYKDGYYYWEETGGHLNDGFACLSEVEQLDAQRYSVWFDICGMGEDWNNDVCYYTPDQAVAAYPPYGGMVSEGHAVINVGASGLGDRSDWHIERLTVHRI